MNQKGMDGVSILQMQMCLYAQSCGGISKAAKAMEISQSSLSKQISGLEAQIGIQIFIRNRHAGLSVTPAGQVLLRSWKKSLDEMQSALSRAAQVQNFEQRHFVVGAVPSLSSEHRTVPIITRFKELHPEMEVRLELAHGKKLVAGVQNKTIDFCLLPQFCEGHVDRTRLRCVDVLQCRMSVGMLPENPLAQRPVLCVRDLKNQKFVLPNINALLKSVRAECRYNGFLPEIAYIAQFFTGISGSVCNPDEIFLTDRNMSDYYNNQCVYRDLEDVESKVLLVSRQGEESELYQDFLTICQSV